MYERFTDRAGRVLALAQNEAGLLGHNFIGTEHILLGLLHEEEGVAVKTLESLGISLEMVRAKVEEIVAPGGYATSGSPPFTPRAKKVLELSLREALHLGHNYIGPEHMLRDLGAELSRVREQVIQLLSPRSGRRARRRQSWCSPRRKPAFSTTTSSAPSTSCWA